MNKLSEPNSVQPSFSIPHLETVSPTSDFVEHFRPKDKESFSSPAGVCLRVPRKDLFGATKAQLWLTSLPHSNQKRTKGMYLYVVDQEQIKVGS